MTETEPGPQKASNFTEMFELLHKSNQRRPESIAERDLKQERYRTVPHIVRAPSGRVYTTFIRDRNIDPGMVGLMPSDHRY